MDNKSNLIPLVIAFLATSACSGNAEPSETEIESAMITQFAIQQELTTGTLFDAELDVEVNHIKKIGCTKALDEGGYSCDVDIDIDFKLPFAGVQKRKGVHSVKLVETADGWKVKG